MATEKAYMPAEIAVQQITFREVVVLILLSAILLAVSFRLVDDTFILFPVVFALSVGLVGLIAYLTKRPVKTRTGTFQEDDFLNQKTSAYVDVHPDGKQEFSVTARELLGPQPITLTAPEHGKTYNLDTLYGDISMKLAKVPNCDGLATRFVMLPTPKPIASQAIQSMFDNLPIALLKISLDGRVVQSNKLSRKLLELDEDEEILFWDVAEGLGRSISDWISVAHKTGPSRRSEILRAKRPIGDVYVQVALVPVSQENNESLLAILHDVTDLKTLEAQFVQSQKMQAIGQLAGGVAHDFNNLLTAISGYCDLLMLRHEKGDPDYGDLMQINQNANRAASLVGQLLAFSRKQTLQPKILTLHDIMSDLTHLLNRLLGEKVALILEHGKDLPPVYVDQRQLEQVIMNLVMNARDAMPSGGDVRIVTSLLDLEADQLRDQATVPAGRYVCIAVSDTGVGIPADQLPKTFEPFYTTKPIGEGTGLGLSTVYGIVKQTGGFVFVDSTEAIGSCFTIYLPVHDVPKEVELVKNVVLPKRTSARIGNAVVLLVEDEAPVRTFAARALRMHGLTVLEASSAEEALEQLKEPDLHVDIIVSDIVMPGMDGPTWVKRALTDRTGTKVIFVSGYAEETYSEAKDLISQATFLPKPFTLQELISAVQNLAA